MDVKRGQTVKMILEALGRAGLIVLAAAEPRVNVTLRSELSRYDKYISQNASFSKKRIDNTFYYLRRKGLLDIEYRGRQIYISLTKAGEKQAGKYKIDDLKINKPQKWDKKWRILIFDIKDKQRIKREALRGKIKELGLFQLQKSVWVSPYEFKKEMATLREFFGLTGAEMKIIEASNIEDDLPIKHHFNLP